MASGEPFCLGFLFVPFLLSSVKKLEGGEGGSCTEIISWHEASEQAEVILLLFSVYFLLSFERKKKESK